MHREPGPRTIRSFPYAGAVHLGLVTVVVEDYDPAISFFVGTLVFDLVEDSPSVTSDGRRKRMGGGPAARRGYRPAAGPGGRA